jgi:hypothetical protein
MKLTNVMKILNTTSILDQYYVKIFCALCFFNIIGCHKQLERILHEHKKELNHNDYYIQVS